MGLGFRAQSVVVRGVTRAGPPPGNAVPDRVVAFIWLTAVAALGMVALALLALAGADAPGGGPFEGVAGAAGRVDPRTLAVLVVASVVAPHFSVTLAPGYKVTLATVVYFADALLLGPAGAVPVVALSELLGQGTLALRRDPATGRPRRGPKAMIFNTAQDVLAVGLGSLVYAALLPLATRGEPPAGVAMVPAGPAGLAAAAVAAVVMYLTNSGLVATIVAFQRGGRPFDVWRARQRGRLPEAAGQFVAGFLVAWVLPREPWLLVPVAAGAGAVGRSLALRVRLAEREAQLARQEAELARQEAEAETLRQVARSKDEFLGTVSHELRTPLSIVCGNADLLLARGIGLDAPAADKVRSILASATQLSRMVDDLLEFARVGRGGLILRPEQTDLSAVIARTLAGLDGQEGGERVVVDLPDRLPAYADPIRVTQAVTNLVTNALKYAPEGPVAVRAYPLNGHPPGAGGAGNGAVLVRVEIEDAGPGIPAAEQPLVWDAFYRGAGATRNGGPRGTGIGLSVVKAVIEAHGGRVGLSSQPGAGARFWFDLPAGKSKATASPAPYRARDAPAPRLA
jgi:signal transduction histidine kinase